MILNKITSYFRACYQADNRDLVITDFFGRKVEKRFLFEGKEELLNGFLPYAPVPEDVGEELSKTLKIYEKEKDLIYASMFIVGRSTDPRDKTSRICAPLFMYPAQLKQIDDCFYVEISQKHRKINFSVLSDLSENSDDTQLFFNELVKNIPEDEISFGDMNGVIRVISKYIPEMDISEAILYPDLISPKKFKRMIQPKQLAQAKELKIIVSSAIGVVAKSVDTLGVLNEMSEIASGDVFSPPLRALFAKEDISFADTEQGRVPAILNLAQQQLFESASQFAFSLAVGPPGTGKSYTIAALAIELFSKGKSVLIVSRTDQAVDVIADKIENQFDIKGVTIRGGRSSYLRDLRKMLQDLLSGMYQIDKQAAKQLKKNKKELEKLDEKIEKLEQLFEKRVEKEQEWGDFLAENQDSSGFFTGLKAKYINWRTERSTPHWELIDELEQLLAEENKKTVSYIMQKYSVEADNALKTNRKELNGFLQALKARRRTRQSELFENLSFKVILKTFPIWLVKLSDIHRVLPLIPEMFDFVIIDEATQCDVTTCIPALQRAKQAVFTGDPNQLRHISFLARHRQEILLKKHELDDYPSEQFDYRTKSVLDFVSENTLHQKQVVFLNEHYRSVPEIINFSNKYFYSNSLKIMTQKPYTGKNNQGLLDCRCQGKRLNNGTNKVEAEFIIDEIEAIIEEQKKLPREACQSIGILSPFRNQADYLSAQIAKRLDINEIDRHQIIVATAYGFQGEERDIMFLSFALDNDSHPSAFYHLNKDDIFNVSVTRARSAQYIVYSMDRKHLKTDSLLRKYLENLKEKPIAMSLPENSVKDVFLKEVSALLASWEIDVYPAYSIAGQCIDIVISVNEKTMGIDLIGFPGQYAEAFSLERYKMLNRAGVPTFPLPYTFWVADREKCQQELKNWIERK